MKNKSNVNSHQLAGQIHSTAIHMLRKLRREDERFGLNAPRLSALSVIVFAGPLSLSNLAAAEQVRPPTMTRIVNALADQGLVHKERDPNDARGIRLSATAAGKTLLAQAQKRRVDSVARQIARLDKDQQRTLEMAANILAEVVRAI